MTPEETQRAFAAVGMRIQVPATYQDFKTALRFNAEGVRALDENDQGNYDEAEARSFEAKWMAASEERSSLSVFAGDDLLLCALVERRSPISAALGLLFPMGVPLVAEALKQTARGIFHATTLQKLSVCVEEGDQRIDLMRSLGAEPEGVFKGDGRSGRNLVQVALFKAELDKNDPVN